MWCSVSGAERERRADAAKSPLLTKVKSSTQKCPNQWKRFLSSGENKTSLMSFLVREWQSTSYQDIISNKHLYVTDGLRCVLLTASSTGVDCTEVPQLRSNQEEADTRMFLHASHSADNGHKKVSRHENCHCILVFTDSVKSMR